jgi:hypothetical protein
MVRRSYVDRIPPPDCVRAGRGWDSIFVDSMEAWAAGSYREKYISANDLAAALGVDGKVDDIGKDFYAHWQHDRERAEKYARGDLVCNLNILDAMWLWR